MCANIELASALVQHCDNITCPLNIDETGKYECFRTSQSESPALSKMPCLDSLAARRP